MKASRISYGLLSSYLGVLTLLRFWQQPAYPHRLWLGGWTVLAILAVATCIPWRGRRITGIAGAMMLGTLLALWSVSRTTHVADAWHIASYANERMYTILGTVADAPDRRQMTTKLTVRADTLVTATGARMPIHGLVLATDREGWPTVRYGDRIRIRGKLKRPGVIDTFSYDDYLSLKNIYAVMPTASVRLEQPLDATHAPPLDWLLWNIFNVRDRFELYIARMQPEPHASLLTGLLTGSRGGMPEQLLDAFRIAGLSHIVAISGYNITIIISLCSGMLFWLPLKRRFPLLVLGIALFTIFVGASASVVRAAVMGVLGLCAMQTNRKADIRLLVLWTAFFMLLFNPKQLWFDAGFQLSFLAVIGLAELSHPISKLTKWLPETLGIRESMTATLAAQAATLPLSMLVFRQVSLVAPFANLLVAPLIPLAMLFGFAGTVIGIGWQALGLVPSYMAWGLLNVIIVVAQACSALPYAALTW